MQALAGFGILDADKGGDAGGAFWLVDELGQHGGHVGAFAWLGVAEA